MREPSHRPGRVPQGSRPFFIGLACLALLVSLLTVASTARTDTILGFPESTATAPETSPVTVVVGAPTVEPGIERLTVTITCFLDDHCRIEVTNGDVFEVCPSSCEVGEEPNSEDPWISANSGDINVALKEIPVVLGVGRVDRSVRDIRPIGVDDPDIPDGFLAISYVPGEARPVVTEVGDAGMTITRREEEAPAVAPQTPEIVDDARIALSAIVLALGGSAMLFGLGWAITQVVRDLGNGTKSGAAFRRDEEDEIDEDVNAPIELDASFTRAEAHERAQVIHDLLAEVRVIESPRDSIQHGYAALETGFGRPHLARLRNETSSTYLARVLGSSSDLREPLTVVTRLFERARFSELPIDAAMRDEMIASLEAVQVEWERRAIELSNDQIPAPLAPQPVEAHRSRPGGAP